MPEPIGPVVIVLRGLAGTVTRNKTLPPDGSFLKSYDPEGHGGAGDATWTANVHDAQWFSGPFEALQCWKQVPASRPTREDGKANRPLTAYTVEIVGVDNV